MLYWWDNIYFGRRSDGSVRILKLASGQPVEVEGDYPEAEIDLTIPAGQWAEIVAAVSWHGQRGGRYWQALEFHTGTSTQTKTQELR